MKNLQTTTIGLLVALLLTACMPAKINYDANELAYLRAVDEQYAHSITKKLLDYKTNPILGYRTAGSDAEHAAADMLVSEMAEIGLTNVLKEPFTVDAWTFEKANLSYTTRQGETIDIVMGAYATHIDTQGPKSFEIIDGNQGTAADLDGLDVAGKFVLIDINQRDEWWINYPAYEAHTRGAAGVIAIQNAGYSEASDEALNAQDICGPSDAVAFSMSKKDATILRENLGDSNSIGITLDAKSIITPDQIAYNVSGKIIGSNPDDYILVTSHYDVYFDGFQDNNAAVGLSLGIAKAFVESGVQPDKTLIFLSHAAEEWGAVNTRYDWSTGAYNQIFNLHPEWVGKAFVDINFELPAYEHEPIDEIRTVYEYESFLTDWIHRIPEVSGAYPDGVKVTGGLRTWSDDYSYSLAGVPALRNDFDSGTFSQNYYHSQLDNHETYNPKVMKFHLNMYGLMVLAFDQVSIMPFDFTQRLAVYKQDLPEYDFKPLEANAKIIYHAITAENKRYADDLVKGDSATILDARLKADTWNKQLTVLFKYAQDTFVRLTWEDTEIMPHQQYQINVDALTTAITSLEQKNGAHALDESLFLIDNNWYAYSFSNETYRYFTDYVLKQDPSRLFWGKGRIVDHLDLYSEIQQLQEKIALGQTDFTPEIVSLSTKLSEQETKLATMVQTLSADMDNFAQKLESFAQIVETK
ncbi:hypothetical protein AwErysi_01170 [Erysipelotrichaceae bacterium]|nr:hypothetical protein AwErysi_01170 [Erysipelotrichaceae bacterium]